MIARPARLWRPALRALALMAFVLATLAHGLDDAGTPDHHAAHPASHSGHGDAPAPCTGSVFEACHAMADIRPAPAHADVSWSIRARLWPGLPNRLTGLRPAPDEPVPTA